MYHCLLDYVLDDLLAEFGELHEVLRSTVATNKRRREREEKEIFVYFQVLLTAGQVTLQVSCFFTPPQYFGGVIFLLQFVCVSVCVSVSL